jgi:acetyl-CoA acetyltransferase
MKGKTMADPIVIVAARRTALGGFLGSLASLTAPQLGSAAMRAALEDSMFQQLIAKASDDIRRKLERERPPLLQ